MKWENTSVMVGSWSLAIWIKQETVSFDLSVAREKATIERLATNWTDVIPNEMVANFS